MRSIVCEVHCSIEMKDLQMASQRSIKIHFSAKENSLLSPRPSSHIIVARR